MALTAFRIDQDLKDRISTLPFLSPAVKSFSHALRYLMELGLESFENSLALVNTGAETDIRFVAQKHDLGDPLTDKELYFLLVYADSALSCRSFLHRETMTTLTEALLSVLKSRCYKTTETTLHFLKKFKFMEGGHEGASLEANQMISVSSQDFYARMEKKAEAFKAKLETHPCPLNDYSLMDPLKAFAGFFVLLAQEEGEHIFSSLAFRQALKPYITSFIQIAKGRISRDSNTPPYHVVSQSLFAHQHELQKPFHFNTKDYSCHVWVQNLQNVSASLIFEQKGATLALPFSAFDDLLEMASFMKQPKTKGLKFETSNLTYHWSSEGEDKEVSILMAQGSSFVLDAKEGKEFVDFLLTVREQFDVPLRALRYQLGSL